MRYDLRMQDGDKIWDGYRRQAGDLTWRTAVIADVPEIFKIWNSTDASLGPQDKPFLFARPVLLTLVAEDTEGRIVDALYVEAEISVTKIGLSKEGFEGSAVIVEDVRTWLKDRGFRVARITVPKMLSARMAETLKNFGFQLGCTRFAHWVRRL